jgi:CBS domain containing-hemolysin-like protein
MAVCIAVVAFFSSSEAALMSVSKIRIRYLAEQGVESAKAVERIISRHDRMFGTILATENMFIILASSLGGALAVKLFGEKGIAVATFVLTLFIVIFGEITPKTYAAVNAETIALLVARPIEIVIKIMAPVVSLFALIASGIIRLLGGKSRHRPYFLTEDEIRTVIEVGEKEKVISPAEKEMIFGVFTFGDTLAKEVMIPRVDIVVVPVDLPMSELMRKIKDTGHSRLPVYRDNIDDIVGVLSAKDVLISLEQGKTEITASEIMRPCLYAPGSQRVTELLAEMKKQRSSIAMVLDEYGGTAGMVTIERLLEEIVGDIEDEFDVVVARFRKIGENVLEVDAKAPIDEVNVWLPTRPLPEGSYQSLGGFLIAQKGDIPKEGEVFTWDCTEFIVKERKGHRLSRIIIRLPAGRASCDGDA